jgi:hypothetical protein
MNTRLPIFAEATEVNALQRQMGAAHIPSWRHVIVGCYLRRCTARPPARLHYRRRHSGRLEWLSAHHRLSLRCDLRAMDNPWDAEFDLLRLASLN